MNTFFNCGVYRWLNTITGKSYVGSSKHLDRRMKEHLKALNASNHSSAKLQASWNKHGSGAFEWEVLVYCPETELLWHEQIAMDAMDVVRNGYNISLHAGAPMRGRRVSEKTKQRMRMSSLVSWTPERRKYQGELQSARISTPETCAKISHSLMGKRTGSHHSEATKEKMRKSSVSVWTEERRALQAEIMAARVIKPETCFKIGQNNRNRRTIKFSSTARQNCQVAQIRRRAMERLSQGAA